MQTSRIEKTMWLSTVQASISMSEIEDITNAEFDELLKQVDLGELDVVELRIDERQDMSEELIGVTQLPRMIH